MKDGAPVSRSTRHSRVAELIRLVLAAGAGLAAGRFLLPGDSADSGKPRADSRPESKPAGPPKAPPAAKAASPDEIRQQLAAATVPGERLDLIERLFTRLSDSVSPAEAIRQALTLDGAEQEAALRRLAIIWQGKDGAPLPDAGSGSGAVRQGGLAIINSDKARPGAAEAWIEAFRQHPARMELAAALGAKLVAADPAKAFALTDGFTPWERRRFLAEVIPWWATKDPAAALQWQSDPANGASDADRRHSWSVAAYENPEWTAGMLAKETDPAVRQEIIRGMAGAKAHAGTREAVAWADSLTDPAERDAAHEAIYEATPRGIGAAMTARDGFPEIKSLLPDGPAAKAGLMVGDRIVELTGPDGKVVPLYERPLETAVSQLRGEPGDTLTLRILRTGPDGFPVEQTVNVIRNQIVLPPEGKNP